MWLYMLWSMADDNRPFSSAPSTMEDLPSRTLGSFLAKSRSLLRNFAYSEEVKLGVRILACDAEII